MGVVPVSGVLSLPLEARGDPMATVLYVDDETALRRAVQAWLERRGDEVLSARTVGVARDILATRDVDGVFIDLWLPDGCGFELIDWIAERDPDLVERIVLVTGDLLPDADTARQLAMLGRPVLTKPFDLVEVERCVRGWEGIGRGAGERAEARQ